MTRTLLIDNIGELTTNDEALGEGIGEGIGGRIADAALSLIHIDVYKRQPLGSSRSKTKGITMALPGARPVRAPRGTCLLYTSRCV